MTLLLVMLGAAVGAPLRYLTDRFVSARRSGDFPAGTVTVNLVGSLVLGALAGVATTRVLPAGLAPLIGTGFCGALTTYSTFAYETVRLIERGRAGLAVLNAGLTVTVGVAAAVGGHALAVVLAGR